MNQLFYSLFGRDRRVIATVYSQAHCDVLAHRVKRLYGRPIEVVRLANCLQIYCTGPKNELDVIEAFASGFLDALLLASGIAKQIKG